MDRQVPDGVGGHGVAGQVNVRGIDVGVVGGIEDRLHDEIHSHRAGAVKLVEIQQGHQDDCVGMGGQLPSDPLGIDIRDGLGIGRRLGQKCVGGGQFYHQGPGAGEIILRGNAEEIADVKRSGLGIDVINAGGERGPIFAQTREPADDFRRQAGGDDLGNDLFSLGSGCGEIPFEKIVNRAQFRQIGAIETGSQFGLKHPIFSVPGNGGGCLGKLRQYQKKYNQLRAASGHNITPRRWSRR
jgi:hypothetical protein